MSTPALSRPRRPAPVFIVDAAELSRFRTWLVGRGYSDHTAGTWARAVRLARAAGIESDADVDARFGALRQDTRTSYRTALREFNRFREAV